MPVIKHNHGWDNSYPAFKPSVYSTGVQSTQPYTKDWPEGSQYGLLPLPGIGSAVGAGASALYSTASGWFSDDSDSSSGSAYTGKECRDSQGLLGTPGALVSCTVLEAAMRSAYLEGQGFQPSEEDDDAGFMSWVGEKAKALFGMGDDEEEAAALAAEIEDAEEERARQRRNATLTVLAAATLGILTTVAVTRHIKYGKVI